MNSIKKIKDKYNGIPLTVKASVVYLLVSLIQRGLGIISSPVYTRILTSKEYGKVSVYYSMEQLIGTIAMFSLSAGCFDIGMQDYKEDRDKFISSILVLSNIITLICAFIIILLYPIVKEYIGLDLNLLIAMFIGFLFQPAFLFWTRKERFEYKYKMPGILTVIGAISSTIFSIILIFVFPSYRVEARIMGSLIPMLLIYIFFWGYLFKRVKGKINYLYWKFAFLFNLPLIPHYMSSYILNSSDRIMISKLVGNSEAAYYSLAYSIASLVTMIWTAINSSMVPFLLDKYEKKDYEGASYALRPVLVIFAFMCTGIILVAPEMIKILATSEYYEAIFIIPPVVGGVFFQSLYYIFTNVLYYYKKPQFIMFASISSAFLNLLLNYLFIPKFGYIVAGYTTLFCYLLQAIIDLLVAKYTIGKNIFDLKIIFPLSLLMIVILVFSNILYMFNLARYIFLMVFLLILFIKRKTIINIFFKNKF